MLSKLREEVWQCNLELPKNDLVKMTSGNVSGRDPETNLVVIKPSGVSYANLTPKSLPVVNLEGEIVEGDLLPSIDTTTHLYVYRKRPDVHGMVHTHSPFASIFAVLGREIPATLTSVGLIGGKIQLGGYYPPLGDDAIGKEMLRVIGDSLAVVMQSHGVFTIGKSATQATRVAVEVEELAKVTHYAMIHGDPIVLTDEQIAEMVDNYTLNYGQDRIT